MSRNNGKMKSNKMPRGIRDKLENNLGIMDRIVRHLDSKSIYNIHFKSIEAQVTEMFAKYPVLETWKYLGSDSKSYKNRYDDIMFLTRPVEDRVEELKRKGVIGGDPVNGKRCSRNYDRINGVPCARIDISAVELRRILGD